VHPALALLPIVPFLPHAARDLNPVVDRARGGHQTASHFEYVFKYPVQAVALLFGLVNGGVLMRGFGSGTWAVLAAALVGRPAGILAAIGLAVAAGLHLPRRVGWREIVVIAFAASSGFTFALFFAAAVVPIGPTLMETKVGALATVAGTVFAFAAARLLRVGRFAT
jgi:Na+:H+ antiporter, NhaA family